LQLQALMPLPVTLHTCQRHLVALWPPKSELHQLQSHRGFPWPSKKHSKCSVSSNTSVRGGSASAAAVVAVRVAPSSSSGAVIRSTAPSCAAVASVAANGMAAYRVELAWIAKNEWWPLLALLCLMECDGCAIAACTWELACTTHRQWHMTLRARSILPLRRHARTSCACHGAEVTRNAVITRKVKVK